MDIVIPSYPEQSAGIVIICSGDLPFRGLAIPDF